jgi:hypothetical protein
MMTDTLATALEALVERCLDQGQVCIVCRWHAAVAARVFLPDGGQGEGTVRGAVLPLCAPCLCSDDLPARISEALSTARAREQGIWN